jgi:hypothetical protein
MSRTAADLIASWSEESREAAELVTVRTKSSPPVAATNLWSPGGGSEGRPA